MQDRGWLFPLLSLAVLAFVGCAGSPPSAQPPESTEQPAEEAAGEKQPAQPAPEETGPEAAEFVVTREVYARTFQEIEDFIQNLSAIIRREDYDTWLTYLSDQYIAHTGDRQFLKEQSEKAVLKKNNVVLRDLKDYFYQVVVPSRNQAKLDDIEFIDENHVKAISVIRDRRVLLYLLVRVDGQWKIGLW